MGVTCVNQLCGGGQYPHEDCGESCVVSIKVDDGKVDSDRLEEAFDALHGDNPADGTGGDVHAQSLQAAGIPAHVAAQNTADALAHCRTNGLNRMMVAIDSDHAGYPSPQSGIGHWILWCGDDVYMQPVGGTLVNYPDDIVEAASQNYHVVVERLIGVTMPSTGGDEPMTPQERQQIATVLSLLVRNQYLSPHIVTRTSSLGEVDGTAQRMLSVGFDAAAWEVVGSDEARKAQG
jgi:hypothetical protein